ncbi:recombinase family protein [Eleftheria terrae]|uniref:recombinase family protein n=1 Tax=Eleftheria terrae TaxID=1597781 RepID=UPI00263B73F5|nr:recombinase family protein [Eleftheria terrae]WKB55970.1 recombinase family protein [Eleftheria terrae]
MSSPRVFGYGRVSTTDQSSENQRQELAAAGYAIEARRWFADEGVSGKVPAMQRPEFARLLAKLDQGDTLVVSKLDRLGRDAIDVLQTIEHLSTEGVRVKVLNLGDVDLTSPAGRAMVTMLSAVARLERDLLVERTQAGLARAKAEGKALGRPAKTSQGDRAEILRRLAAGDTVSAVARDYCVSRATVISIREGAASVQP